MTIKSSPIHPSLEPASPSTNLFASLSQPITFGNHCEQATQPTSSPLTTDYETKTTIKKGFMTSSNQPNSSNGKNAAAAAYTVSSRPVLHVPSSGIQHMDVHSSVMEVARIHLKDIVPQKPPTLSGFDDTLWGDFAGRMSPIRSQVQRSLYYLVASGIAFFVLLFVTITMQPVATFGLIVMAILNFVCRIVAVMRKSKKFNEEVTAICAEFEPRFRDKGFHLEYVQGRRGRSMVVISRVVG